MKKTPGTAGVLLLLRSHDNRAVRGSQQGGICRAAAGIQPRATPGAGAAVPCDDRADPLLERPCPVRIPVAGSAAVAAAATVRPAAEPAAAARMGGAAGRRMLSEHQATEAAVRYWSTEPCSFVFSTRNTDPRLNPQLPGKLHRRACYGVFTACRVPGPVHPRADHSCTARMPPASGCRVSAVPTRIGTLVVGIGSLSCTGSSRVFTCTHISFASPALSSLRQCTPLNPRVPHGCCSKLEHLDRQPVSTAWQVYLLPSDSPHLNVYSGIYQSNQIYLR